MEQVLVWVHILYILQVIMTRLFLLVLVYCASYRVEGIRARLPAQLDGMATVVKGIMNDTPYILKNLQICSLKFC